MVIKEKNKNIGRVRSFLNLDHQSILPYSPVPIKGEKIMKELAIGYCRVSTKKQEKRGYSLEAQKDIINEYAKDNNYKLAHIFPVQESGSKLERKELFKAFHFCIEKNIKVVLVSDSDRWTRNRRLDMDACEFLKEHNMRVYLIKDNRSIPEATTAALEFQHNIKITTDEYFIAILKEKILRGVKKKLEKSEFPSTPPLGYKSIRKTDDNPHRIIQTEKASKVKKLLELFNTGKFTLRQTVKLAKDMGLKPKKKDEFKIGTLARLIKNRFYYGEFEYKLPSINGDGESKIYKNKTKDFEPIITKKVWEQNQAILKKRQTNHSGRNANQHTYNNLIFCGKCGGLVFGFQPKYKVKWKTKAGIQTKDYQYEPHYICNKNSYYTIDGKNAVWKDYVNVEEMVINQNIMHEEDRNGKKKIATKKGTAVEKRKCDMPYFLESDIEKILMDEIGTIKFNKKIWDKMKADLFKDEQKEFLDFEIRSLRNELTKNEIRLDELYEDYKKEVIDEEFFTTRKQRVDDRQKEAKERLAELVEDREMHDERIGKAIKILDGLKNWEAIWKEATPDKKRSLVNLMTIKVLTRYSKGEYKGKAYENKQLRIVFTPEIEELFEIGLLEAHEEMRKEDPKYGIFNSPNLGDS